MSLLFYIISSFTQSCIPRSPIGIYNPGPRHKIRTEEDLKAAILSHNKHTKMKAQKKVHKTKITILMTATKPTNVLANVIQAQEFSHTGKASRGIPRLPCTKIQKKRPKRTTGRWSGIMLRLSSIETSDPPSLLPLEMDTDDHKTIGKTPMTFYPENYGNDCMSSDFDHSLPFRGSAFHNTELDTLMEDAPSLLITWPTAELVLNPSTAVDH
ncbi:hypothetical protein L211DRAFT_850747 [Terfezia boudieri ATCC MYA-4762]|uniref:Uncharacterized protein n=1 Tax=Terfezia boudieri ATCC MYA-4762 TaxID=1051890 RepID=A0A3N4LLG0_9PEZI|nr:hypothetical protein L211DRAFT_850747 [Terfezia boudieri ATCC MYA-4762]